jgi:hypothetical protein
MRKANPKFRWHVTAEERKQIRAMTRKGVRQSQIARALGIGAPSVSKAQVAMGLPTRLAVPEKKVMELFEKGWGGYRIARHLRVPVNQVYGVAHRHNFRRSDAAGYPTPPENEAAFIAAVKNREDYVIRLAAKYKIGIIKAGRLARQALNCPQFRPGATKPPLSSNFPQKHFDPKMGKPDDIIEMCVRIVQSAIKALDGKMPGKTILVTALTSRFAPENPPADFGFGAKVWVQARLNFIMGLTIACDCVARDRAALWTN